MPCRICTTNDLDSLVEELAERMWLSRRDRDIDPDKWEDAGPYWQRAMREFASETIKMARHG